MWLRIFCSSTNTWMDFVFVKKEPNNVEKMVEDALGVVFSHANSIGFTKMRNSLDPYLRSRRHHHPRRHHSHRSGPQRPSPAIIVRQQQRQQQLQRRRRRQALPQPQPQRMDDELRNSSFAGIPLTTTTTPMTTPMLLPILQPVLLRKDKFNTSYKQFWNRKIKKRRCAGRCYQSLWYRVKFCTTKARTTMTMTTTTTTTTTTAATRSSNNQRVAWFDDGCCRLWW